MTVSLYLRCGKLKKAAALRHVVKDLPSDAFATWIEPVPHLPKNGAPGPLPGFVGIRHGLPDPETLPPVAEMRMFWPEATLHFVAGDGGLSWAAFATTETALPFGDTGEPCETLSNLTEERGRVVWRQDLNRFLGAAAGAARIGLPARIRAFREGKRLVTWWLTAA